MKLTYIINEPSHSINVDTSCLFHSKYATLLNYTIFRKSKNATVAIVSSLVGVHKDRAYVQQLSDLFCDDAGYRNIFLNQEIFFVVPIDDTYHVLGRLSKLVAAQSNVRYFYLQFLLRQIIIAMSTFVEMVNFNCVLNRDQEILVYLSTEILLPCIPEAVADGLAMPKQKTFIRSLNAKTLFRTDFLLLLKTTAVKYQPLHLFYPFDVVNTMIFKRLILVDFELVK